MNSDVRDVLLVQINILQINSDVRDVLLVQIKFFFKWIPMFVMSY